MDILLVGGGGREHAILKKLRQSPLCGHVYALPGNGGMAAEAELVPIKATDLEAIVGFVREHPVDFAVVAPDDPLVGGLVDRLRELGVPSFGPDARAAIIEGSKRFAKELMRRYQIPTAGYQVFTSAAAAYAYLETASYPQVLKADGLALGKGVTIAENWEQARQAVARMMEERVFGASGDVLVVEEFLTGPEVSVLCLTDGQVLKPLVSSMDHKRIFDHDQGPNTGGMGAVAPNPCYTPAIADQCMREIFLPTIRALAAEGRPFRGCLYFGLMLTEQGPKVIEYNCRFGDPETQAVLPLLESDLLELMLATAQGRLAETEVKLGDGASCCVVLASGGYPGQYQTGCPLSGQLEPTEASVFHAGTRLDQGQLVTSGGRVLGVTAVAGDLATAIAQAYRAADAIHFQDAYCRRDIGQRALQAQKQPSASAGNLVTDGLLE